MNTTALFQIIYIFIIPISLVYFKVLSFKYRHFALVLISLGTALIMYIEKWTLVDVGLRFDNLGVSYLPYFIFTIVGLLFIITVLTFEHKEASFSNENKHHLLYLFIPISFLQEFLFRSFLVPKLMQVFNYAFVVIFVSALIFMYLHTIYSNNKLSLFITFIAGIGFTLMYLLFPNLILITISHAVLNFTVVLYGYFNKRRI